jgi:ABC-type transport system involved in cytochrome c biogenesis permease subunit
VQLYAVYFATNTKIVQSIAKGTAYSGLLIIAIILVLFWKFSGHATNNSDYELVIIYALAIVSILIWLDYKYKCEIIGAYALPCIILGLAKETTHVFRIDTTVSLFQNNWCFSLFLITHSLGSAFFAISLGISVMYLLALRNEKHIIGKLLLVAPLPSAELLDRLLYTIIKIGFLLLTLSIITRTVWVTSTWGFEWGGIWQYATWVLYAILMMYRASNEQKANLFAWGTILCFFVSMHGYVGYKDFLRGL